MSTAIVTIGLTERNVEVINGIKAQTDGKKKIMFPVFTFHGDKKSLRKQVRKIVAEIFDVFDKEIK